jgi:hypothetical protein
METDSGESYRQFCVTRSIEQYSGRRDLIGKVTAHGAGGIGEPFLEIDNQQGRLNTKAHPAAYSASPVDKAGVINLRLEFAHY